MIGRTLERLEPDKRAMALQAVRYALAGFVITLMVAASYWAVTEFGGLDPQLSFLLVFLFFSGVSYVTHGAFSFKDHGARDRHHVRATRFLIVNILGFVLNQFFIWLLVKQLGGPSWWPIPAFLFVTPVVTFALHRRWVYS